MLPVLAAVTGSGALALEIRRAVVVRGRREEQKRAEETIRGLTEALEEAESNWRRAEELVQVRRMERRITLSADCFGWKRRNIGANANLRT